jgi:hypothetical protein
MLSITPELEEQLTSSYTYITNAQSLRRTTILSDNVPIASGSLTYNRDQTIPESLELTVPKYDGATDWNPVSNSHPLSPVGQQISLRIGVYVNGIPEWLQQGWFPIIETKTSDTTVSVSCRGILNLIDEAKFTAPFTPSGSFETTIRKLVEPAITCLFDPLLTDRAIPIGMHWDEDRLRALTEVLDAWPADAEATADGYLYIHVPVDESTLTSADSVWSLTDDAITGTVIGWTGETSRSNFYNAVVARGEDSAGNQIQAVIYDSDKSSATYRFGKFSALPVPYLYSSALLTTLAQCQAAAANIMARKKRAESRKLSFQCIPHPALRLGDAVLVTSSELGFTSLLATIESYTLPLSPGDGAMSGTLKLIDQWIVE